MYDFGGFHPRYYRMTYRTPDAGDLARPSWSADFDAWAADALSRGDVEMLARYQAEAPGMPYAHPTVDHYIPLFITLGAAERPDQPVSTAIEGYSLGLSKRSFQVA